MDSNVTMDSMELVNEELRGRERQLFDTCVRNGVEFRWPEKEETDEQRACRRAQLRKDCKDRRQTNRLTADSSTKRKNAMAMRIARAEMNEEQRADVRELNATNMRIARVEMNEEQRTYHCWSK